MPKFKIEHRHSLPADEVRQRLDVLSERLSTKYGIDAKWKSSTEATFKRTGATGAIHVEPEKVIVDVDLSFMLAPMKDKVEERIRGELQKALA